MPGLLNSFVVRPPAAPSGYLAAVLAQSPIFYGRLGES
jgi:hypothetical protein